MNKTYVLAFFLAFIAESDACHAQFRNTKWGDGIDAVITAEQLQKTEYHISENRLSIMDNIVVGNKKLRAQFFFADGNLTEGRYSRFYGDLSYIETIASALSDFRHFRTLLEMKYGIANSETVPAEFEALLEANGPLYLEEDLKSLERQWITQFEHPTLFPDVTSVWSDQIRLTWESDGTAIELVFVVVSSDTMDFQLFKDRTHAGINILYKDSSSWEEGRTWRREQWDAEQKRKAEQEKKALLKGL